MIKSFTVRFPIQQGISAGLSWAQINQKSWIEINLLSWREIITLVRRYLDYSVRFSKKVSAQAAFTMKQSFTSSFVKQLSNNVLFTLKKVFQVR